MHARLPFLRASPHTSDGAALSRGETVSRRPLHPSGAFHGGISPGRFRGVWLHRSPPRLSAHHLSAYAGALEALTTRMRHTRMRAHATLLTLTPAFPSRPDPCGPAFQAGLPLLGLSKDRPSIESRRRVRRPGLRLRRSLRGTTAGRSRVPPSWFRTTSAAFSSPTVQVCCALLPILGFIVFLPVAKRASPRCVPALRSFPSADSGDSGSRRNRGLASRTTHLWACPSPLALPPHPSLRAP